MNFNAKPGWKECNPNKTRGCNPMKYSDAPGHKVALLLGNIYILAALVPSVIAVAIDFKNRKK